MTAKEIMGIQAMLKEKTDILIELTEALNHMLNINAELLEALKEARGVPKSKETGLLSIRIV